MKTPPQTPTLTVVSPVATPDSTPANLGQAGRDLWRTVQDEYGIADSGGLLLLTQIAEAADEIAACSAQIAADGMMLRGKFGSRPHPMITQRTALRGFMLRALTKLGIALEPVRPPGRPPDSRNWP